jgi:hypothetical protein
VLFFSGKFALLAFLFSQESSKRRDKLFQFCWVLFFGNPAAKFPELLSGVIDHFSGSKPRAFLYHKR